MPTLTRLILMLLGLAGLVYGAAFLLAESVEPNVTEITLPVPMSIPDKAPSQ